MTDSTPPPAPAGWFPTGVKGQERYWDGTSWTNHVRAVGGTTVPAYTAPAPPHTPAPTPGKKPRNIVGIIALAVAGVGFVFACIPGALIVGWILLPIGFILGIVALIRKENPKWQGVTAITVSVIGAIVGAVVALTVAAGAVSDAADDAVADEVGTSDAAEDESAREQDPAVDDEPAIAGAEDLVLEESAFGIDTESGMGWYAVRVTNPNSDYVFADAGVDVEAYDADGVLIDTDSTYTTILSGSTWYVGNFYNIGSAQIDHIEVRGPTADAATHSPGTETGSFTMGPITTGSEYDYMTANGTVTSEFSEDQDMVRIDLIARDGSGKIVGVYYTFTDRVPSGGTAAWTVEFWNVPLDSKVEAYPHL